MDEISEKTANGAREEKPAEKIFRIVIEDLTPEQENQFRAALEELHISKDDLEMFQLMRALQIYKAYYESIPQRIEQAAASAEETCNKISYDIETCAAYFEGIRDIANNSIEKFGTNVEDRIRVSFNEIDDQIYKKGHELSEKLKEKILEECENTLPLTELKKAGSILTEAVVNSNRATEAMQKSIKFAKWTHYGVITAAVAVVVLVSWIFFHFRYATRLSEERITVVDQIGINQAVLIELSKAGKKLEITTSKKNTKLLSMKDADGWKSTTGEGVIEFK